MDRPGQAGDRAPHHWNGSWSLASELGAAGAYVLDIALVCTEDAVCLAFVADLPTGRAVLLARSVDHGVSWTTGPPLAVESPSIDARVFACSHGPFVHLAYVDGGALQTLTSSDHGASWPSTARTLHDPAVGAVGASLALACEGGHLLAAFTTTNDALVLAQTSGSAPTSRTVRAPGPPLGDVALSVDGDYVFCAWRDGTVGDGSARIRIATSVDGGVTTTEPAGFGDGTAAQERPVLVQDSARIWLGWLDHRGGSARLHRNGTER